MTLSQKKDNWSYIFFNKYTDTLCHAIFIICFFLIDNYIYAKNMIPCVTWHFNKQKAGNFKKSKTMFTIFSYTKSWDFALRIFSSYFWNWRRRGRFYILKMHFVWNIYTQKTRHFLLRFYKQKTRHFESRFIS